MDSKKEIKGYIVDGFLFETEKEAEIAKKELQGIKYLERNNNLKDVKVMKQVYQKLLQQNLFKTPVGFHYLKHLQSLIAAKEGVENVAPIPVSIKGQELTGSQNIKHAMAELDDVGFKYRKRFRISVAIIGVLTACLVFMIIIASTTNQPNILNYEEKIIDKYEHWEQELEKREELLKE